jgi:hypothetical protein
VPFAGKIHYTKLLCEHICKIKQYKRTLKLSASIEINFKGIIDFSSYNSDNKLGQWKLKRTGLHFLISLFSQLFLWTAQAAVAYAQAAAEKN